MVRRLLIILYVLAGLNATAQDTLAVHQFVDAWHKAASTADEKVFFGSIADDGIYIGTADFERWNKTEFEKFALPFFQRESAWDFKSFGRRVHISPDGQYAWFSELLTTWMGVCRGSGIVVRTSSGWKIKQYHLAVTVPNEIIEDFIKLVDGFHRKQGKE